MKRSTQALLLVLALGVGYGAHYGQQLVEQANKPVVVTQQRMSELTKSPCAKNLTNSSTEISLIKAVFDDPSTAFSDLDIQVLKETGGCVFEYAVSSDSYIQGRGVVRFDKERIVREVNFYNRLDSRLMGSNVPSFSVFFSHDGNRTYIFETLHNKLYATRGKGTVAVDAALPGFGGN